MTTPPPERNLSLRVITMPKDTNQYGTIFGGVILSWIDQAGFVEARRHGLHRWVTVAVDRVVFSAPVLVGDIVELWSRTSRKGTSSVTVEIEVRAQRYTTGEMVMVTTASLAMVAVDQHGNKIPFTHPPTVNC